MSKKKLLILYTKNPDEVYNRKSAIGSYVNCLAGLLSESFDVTLNYPKVDYKTHINLSSSSSNSKLGWIKKLIPKRIKSYLRDKRHFDELEELKKKIVSLGIKFDTILEFYNYGSDVGKYLADHFNCPLNLIYDGPVFEEYEFFNGHKSHFEKRCKQLEKLSFEKASKIVVYSQPMVDFCLKNIHNEQEKYHIHQNIDFSRFHFFEGEKDYSNGINICFVGSFLKWHRVDLLLQAYRKLLDERLGVKTHLYLIGDGVEKYKMQKLAHQLKLNGQVTFTGFLDGDELIDLQKKMHIGIMPSSNWYGAPNKIFEYGAMKMAVIAPDTPTIRDLFGNCEIILIQNSNLSQLCRKLIEFAENETLLAKLGHDLNSFISNRYSEERTILFYMNLLNN